MPAAKVAKSPAKASKSPARKRAASPGPAKKSRSPSPAPKATASPSPKKAKASAKTPKPAAVVATVAPDSTRKPQSTRKSAAASATTSTSTPRTNGGVVSALLIGAVFAYLGSQWMQTSLPPISHMAQALLKALPVALLAWQLYDSSLPHVSDFMQQNIAVLGLNVFLTVYAKLQFSTPNMLNFTNFMRGGLAVFTWQHLTMDDAEVAGIAQYVAVADAAAFTFMLHAKHGLASAIGEAANLYTISSKDLLPYPSSNLLSQLYNITTVVFVVVAAYRAASSILRKSTKAGLKLSAPSTPSLLLLLSAVLSSTAFDKLWLPSLSSALTHNATAVLPNPEMVTTLLCWLSAWAYAQASAAAEA